MWKRCDSCPKCSVRFSKSLDLPSLRFAAAVRFLIHGNAPVCHVTSAEFREAAFRDMSLEGENTHKKEPKTNTKTNKPNFLD